MWYDINTIDTNTNPLSVLKEIESDTLRKKFLDEINKILRSFVHFEVVVDETYDEGVVIRHVYFRELTTERPHAWDELGDGVRLFSALWISVIIHNRRDCILFFQEPEHHIAP